MLDDQLRLSRKYVDENEYDAEHPMPVISEQSIAVDVYSPEGNKDTLKLKVSLRTQYQCITFWFICKVNSRPTWL
jgi:hypothetical protein